MPHKRNPIASENICGLARLLRGYALAALEDIALWHERDISHSSGGARVVAGRHHRFWTTCSHRMTGVVADLQVYPDRMRANMAKTVEIVCSQRLVIALTKKGLQKQKAYEFIQRHALAAWTMGNSFRAAVQADPDIRAKLSPAEMEACFDLKPFVKNIALILQRTLR